MPVGLTFENIRHYIFKLFHEVKIFIVIFLISFLWMVVFTNAEMFWEVLFTEDVKVDDFSQWTDKEENIQIHNAFVVDPVQESLEKKQKEEIDILVQSYQEKVVFEEEDKKKFQTSEEYLKSTRKNQLFDFNMLPPTDRIIIPSIGVDVPIVDSKVNNINDFTSKDFDPDLMSGVVKYPTTPEPGTNWNTFIFGHTSQEWWIKNPYGTVFAKIPKLKNGETITVVWEGQRYTYKIIAKEIVYPKGVEAVYQEYQKIDKDYLTLMGCYPIGSDSKRIMIIAERI